MKSEVLQAHIVTRAREVFQDQSISYEGGKFFRDILGFDSVRAIQYILAIEEALGVILNEEEVDRMHTMGDMLTILHSKTNSLQTTGGP